MKKKLELIDHLLEGKVRQLQKMYTDKVSWCPVYAFYIWSQNGDLLIKSMLAENFENTLKSCQSTFIHLKMEKM